MLKHSFTYTIIEDYIDVDPESKKVIKKIILKDDEKIPGMNQTSFYDINESLNKLVIKKLGPLLKYLFGLLRGIKILPLFLFMMWVILT